MVKKLREMSKDERKEFWRKERRWLFRDAVNVLEFMHGKAQPGKPYGPYRGLREDSDLDS